MSRVGHLFASAEGTPGGASLNAAGTSPLHTALLVQSDARAALSKGPCMGNLLHYALVFLVVALIAAAVGFGGVAGFAMEAARLLFWVFVILFVVSLVVGLVRRA
jgi:uncharacterized membrane protein YtjA (UPF0391 family)